MYYYILLKACVTFCYDFKNCKNNKSNKTDSNYIMLFFMCISKFNLIEMQNKPVYIKNALY